MEVATPAPFFDLDPNELDIRFGVPGPQGRGSVALRAVLFVPLFTLVGLVGVLGAILAVIGWFAAIVLGRLPRWIAVFERQAIAYAIGVNAYMFLLSDKYPPFAYPLGEYQIAVELSLSRLSRLKVLFRWLLGIPASVVAGLVRQGLLVLSPVIWLSTLVLGRTPRPFFGAAAAVIRYEARYYAYMALLTDKYPQRLFGDGEWVPAPEGAGREFRVSLSDGARRLVRLIVVLGIAVGIGNVVLQYELRPRSNPAIVAAEDRIARATVAYPEAVAACGTLRCIRAADHTLGKAWYAFGAKVSRISFPDSKRAEVSAVVHEARELGQMFLAASTSKTSTERDKALRNLDSALTAFEKDAPAVFGHGL